MRTKYAVAYSLTLAGVMAVNQKSQHDAQQLFMWGFDETAPVSDYSDFEPIDISEVEDGNDGWNPDDFIPGVCDMTDAVDSQGDGCEWYAEYPNSCGFYDTEDFDAYRDCCGCVPDDANPNEHPVEPSDVEPIEPVPVPEPEPAEPEPVEPEPVEPEPLSHGDGTCDSTEYADTAGDGCDWYVGRENSCGNHDTADFQAKRDCCACLPECDTTEFADTAGDGCDWYVGREDSCGNHDTDDFHANEDCCACINYVPDPLLGCDSTTEVDTAGDGCDWYTTDRVNSCGNHDTDDFHANEDCCNCIQAALNA